jgi:ABC-type branched-subunit amino acid transport system ATPase component
MTDVLQTENLVRRFGGLLATDHVSFSLARGARHALIGPNGAGKTTFVNLLTGVLAPTSGRILLDGADITRLRPDQRVRRGMARTFQINQLFAGMTPLETARRRSRRADRISALRQAAASRDRYCLREPPPRAASRRAGGGCP